MPGPSSPDPPQCSLLHSHSLAPGPLRRFPPPWLPPSLPGLRGQARDLVTAIKIITQPASSLVILVGWAWRLLKVPSGRLASPGSRCSWLGLGAERSFGVTPGPYTVDSKLYGPWQGLGLSDSWDSGGKAGSEAS